MNKKGVALFFVLAILLVVSILANIILSFIVSQASLTTHQVKRMQAYYAAQAGVNYAIEKLRLNNSTWNTTVSSASFRICGSAYSSAHPTLCNGNNITEPAFSPLINYVVLTIGPLNATNNNRTISAMANYSSG